MKRTWSLGLGVIAILGWGSAGCGSAPQGSPPAEAVAAQTEASLVADPSRRPHCDTRAGRHERLEELLRSPIVPPSNFGGLNVDSGPFGLTLEQAEEVNCAADIAPPDPSIAPYAIASWGKHQEVQIYYNPEKGDAILNVVMNKGYEGEARVRSRAGGRYGDHRYTIGIGTLTKDGRPFSLDVDLPPGNPSPNAAVVTELYDAIIATFAPDTAPSDDCEATRACFIGFDENDVHYIGFRPMNFYLVIQPNERTPSQMYSIWKPAQ